MFYVIAILMKLPRLLHYTRLLIPALIIIISFSVSAQQDSVTKILLTFSEPMSREFIFDTGNYNITANGTIPVELIKVGAFDGDTLVVLFFYKKNNWNSFQITVHNLQDKTGNLITDQKNFAEITTSITNITSAKFINH